MIFMILKGATGNLPRNSHTLNALIYKADCAYKRPRNLDKISHSNSFYGCSMFISKPICPVHMSNYLYDMLYLGP